MDLRVDMPQLETMGSPAGQGQEHDSGCAVWLAPRHSLCPLWLMRGEFGPFAAILVNPLRRSLRWGVLVPSGYKVTLN